MFPVFATACGLCESRFLPVCHRCLPFLLWNGSANKTEEKQIKLVFVPLYILLEIIFYIIEYGHEAKPSILGLQIVFLAARRDDYYYGDDYRARLEL